MAEVEQVVSTYL